MESHKRDFTRNNGILTCLMCGPYPRLLNFTDCFEMIKNIDLRLYKQTIHSEKKIITAWKWSFVYLYISFVKLYKLPL